MTYRVFYTLNVRTDIATQVRYLKDRHVAPEVVEEWFTKLFDLVDSLYELPLRFPVAEPETAAQGFEIRKMPFGDYLVFYRVDEGKRLVEVLSFQHGARRSTS